MHESGIPAHCLGQGLGSHSGLSEGRGKTGQLSKGETSRLGQKPGGARTASGGEKWGQPWKVEAPSPHFSAAVRSLSQGGWSRSQGSQHPGFGSAQAVLLLPHLKWA